MIQGQGKTIKTYSPTDGTVYKEYQLHTKEQAESIIEESHKSFQDWRETNLSNRIKIVNKIGDILEERKAELSKMITKQMGKPIAQSKDEIDLCVAICRYTAKEAESVLSDEKRELLDGSQGLVTYQPLGVILGMQPWNFPFYQCIRYSIAVIIGGNTTVFKHAEICFETAEKISEIYKEAGLPEGVFSPIFVEDETADELIEHKLVRGVTFTGSAEGGKLVAKKAGENLKKSVMELGGSDAYIVLADTKIDDIIDTCVEGRINNGGQTCVAAKRFIIEDSVYDEFKEKFVAAMKEVNFGDPENDDCQMGPLAREDLRDDLHKQVKESIEKGATLLCGGEIPDRKGSYYPATVLENLSEDSPAYKDELFGPVASLFRAKDLAHAIEIANDHRYGLGGGIFSGDKDKAIEIAKTKLNAGILNVNRYGVADPNVPFGGVKDSGYGREHGGFGLREFVNVKTVMIGKAA